MGGGDDSGKPGVSNNPDGTLPMSCTGTGGGGGGRGGDGDLTGPASPPPPGGPDDEGDFNRPQNAKKQKDSYLKRKGIDAHRLKGEYGADARYDIFKDRDGRLWLGPHRKGNPLEWIRTDYFI